MLKPSTAQDAIRLLYIFVHGSDPLDDDPNGYAGCFEGKAKLHAMDFWVRYPDYLAYELLNKYQESNNIAFLHQAMAIVHDEEPDLRRIPMIRYKFGAFDDINESLSILISKGLVSSTGKKTNGKIQHYDFKISAEAYKIAQAAIEEFTELKWFDDRAKLVSSLCAGLGGAALKEIQYKHMSYASTSLGTTIPPIKNEVINRLENYNSL
jgi:hypothetical protein